MDIQIRPARATDCTLVAESLREFDNDERKTRRKVQAQEAGQGILLIAWCNDLPVGRLWLRWAGSHEIPRIKKTHPIAATLGPCPSFGEIEVAPRLRGNGIGSQLIGYAEGVARQYGYPRVAITAAHDDRPRQLYERLGYTDPGIGVFHTSGTYVDEYGSKVQWNHGHQVILVKEL
ncbi:MAG: GNAT family N-acetyltransferase [Candidatus Latescibacteria bacterium]|nr:GNAT family N-acetyltransferase [Candidatus Latescibacterota bacterium]